MARSLHELFSLVCGQQNSWALGGRTLPFCERCTGLYVGAVLALVLLLVFKPRPTTRTLWVHGILLLLMLPFGYHLVPQSSEIRTLTGQLFAFGLVYYLALLPAERFGMWKRGSSGDFFSYSLAGLASIPVLQLGVHLGGTATNALVSWTGFAGFLIYAALILANLVLIPKTLWPFRERVTDASPS